MLHLLKHHKTNNFVNGLVYDNLVDQYCASYASERDAENDERLKKCIKFMVPAQNTILNIMRGTEADVSPYLNNKLTKALFKTTVTQINIDITFASVAKASCWSRWYAL